MFQDYNPNTDGSGLSSFTYPAFMYNFLTAFSDQQISTKNIVSTQFLQNINLNSNYVIAEVHLDSNYHLSTGAVANHYLQVIDDQNSTLQFWSWGTDENYSQLTDDFLNGIHELFIIPKR